MAPQSNVPWDSSQVRNVLAQVGDFLSVDEATAELRELLQTSVGSRSVSRHANDIPDAQKMQIPWTSNAVQAILRRLNNDEFTAANAAMEISNLTGFRPSITVINRMREMYTFEIVKNQRLDKKTVQVVLSEEEVRQYSLRNKFKKSDLYECNKCRHLNRKTADSIGSGRVFQSHGLFLPINRHHSDCSSLTIEESEMLQISREAFRCIRDDGANAHEKYLSVRHELLGDSESSGEEENFERSAGYKDWNEARSTMKRHERTFKKKTAPKINKKYVISATDDHHITSHPKLLRIMRNSRILVADGTFTLPPKEKYGYEQVHIIHAFVDVPRGRGTVTGEWMPVAFALMKGKSEEDYVGVFDALKRAAGGRLRCARIHLDHEMAQWNAYGRVLVSRDRIFGCTFHLSQRLRKRAGELGLLAAANKFPIIQTYVRACGGLFFLPDGDIHKFWNMILQHPPLPPADVDPSEWPTEQLHAFKNYVARQWLDLLQSFAGCKRTRNTNPAESFNSRYKVRVESKNTIEAYLKVLRKICKESIVRHTQLTAKNRKPRNQGLEFMATDQKLMDNLDEYLLDAAQSPSDNAFLLRAAKRVVFCTMALKMDPVVDENGLPVRNLTSGQLLEACRPALVPQQQAQPIIVNPVNRNWQREIAQKIGLPLVNDAPVTRMKASQQFNIAEFTGIQLDLTDGSFVRSVAYLMTQENSDDTREKVYNFFVGCSSWQDVAVKLEANLIFWDEANAELQAFSSTSQQQDLNVPSLFFVINNGIVYPILNALNN